jgi:hypothetical protein
MNKILEVYLEKFILVFFNYIFIYSKFLAYHLKHGDNVWTILVSLFVC